MRSIADYSEEYPTVVITSLDDEALRLKINSENNFMINKLNEQNKYLEHRYDNSRHCFLNYSGSHFLYDGLHCSYDWHVSHLPVLRSPYQVDDYDQEIS